MEGLDADNDIATGIMFQEPEGYFKPKKEPTFVCHRTRDGRNLSLRLVGDSPLWGHLLWNAGRAIADYLENEQQSLIQDRCVLELGAGAGLPSLICALGGAKQVIVTDYPDADLIENLSFNIRNYSSLPQAANIEAAGYLWGAETADLTSRLSHSDGFDLLILADVLFNHSEHSKLLLSIQKTLSRTSRARALVFFTPYRPWLLQKDLAFFDLARQGGFVVSKILEKTLDYVMFEKDPGDETLRRTVFGYSLAWSDELTQDPSVVGGG